MGRARHLGPGSVGTWDRTREMTCLVHVYLVEEYEDLKIKDQLAGGTLCLVPWWDNVFCSHDWESIVLKSAIHETKIRTTNGREKQGCKRYFGFHSRVGYMRETYLMSTPLGRM